MSKTFGLETITHEAPSSIGIDSIQLSKGKIPDVFLRGCGLSDWEDVLCPIALDKSWLNSNWPKRLMEQIMEYNIPDFSNWNDDKAFEQVFNKMISGL